MALGPMYCKQLKEELRRHANFPPNRPIVLGDYGVVRDEVFERMGHVRQLGITFETVEGSGQSGFQYKSRGNTDFALIAKGDVQAGGVAAVKAGLNLKFSSANAVFFVAAGCTVSTIDDIRALEESLNALLDQGRWESDFYVVTEVNIATKTTAIASADQSCEILLEATSPAIETIQLGDASLELQVKRSRNTALEIVTENNQTPLMQLSRLQGWFHHGLRPEAMMPSAAGSRLQLRPDRDTEPPVQPAPMLGSFARTDAETQQSASFLRSLAVAPSDFEVGRAISAYIPLLRACYDFSHGNEHPDIPAGFEIVAPIRSQHTEGVAAFEAITPEAQAAVANDFRAIAQESGRAGKEADHRESIASPDAFGFVFRETHTGALVVGIRGTQTPEEWVKNFTAIPVLFNQAPDFGLVHLGFMQLWNRIRQPVLDALQSLPQDARITFLGHSLGAAMGTLGTVDIKKHLNRPNVDLCTFGSPRTGKVIFRIKFNNLVQRAFRVTELRDIVPHVPSVLTAWNHVGVQIEVRSKEENAHSLESYLAGLQNLGAPKELAQPGTPALEAVHFPGVMGARTL